VLRRILLSMLCCLLLGNGPLDVVRCETPHDSSLSLSFDGSCFCHPPRVAACASHAHDEQCCATAAGCEECGCSDTVVSELDPTPGTQLSLSAPVWTAVGTVPLPTGEACSYRTPVRNSDLPPPLLQRTAILRI
jgi:hypothetical protein